MNRGGGGGLPWSCAGDGRGMGGGRGAEGVGGGVKDICATMVQS